MAGRHGYRIDQARDHVSSLHDVLETLENEGRRAINVIWQPQRQVTQADGQKVFLDSGYVVISEVEDFV